MKKHNASRFKSIEIEKDFAHHLKMLMNLISFQTSTAGEHWELKETTRSTKLITLVSAKSL